MFARKVRVLHKGQPCPLKWLDNFSMRSFTNDAVFDDTLPTGDGVLEIGARVPLAALRDSMEDWFRKKGYIGQDDALDVAESKTESRTGSRTEASTETKSKAK